MSQELKLKCYEACRNYAEEKISTTQSTIAEYRQAANNETKSTAGDKHDVSRAMMQLEQEKFAKQLQQNKKLMAVLSQIDPSKLCKVVEMGALVTTDSGKFYIAIGAGKLSSENVMAISLASPIAQKMFKCSEGEIFEFNCKKIKIRSIY